MLELSLTSYTEQQHRVVASPEMRAVAHTAARSIRSEDNSLAD